MELEESKGVEQGWCGPREERSWFWEISRRKERRGPENISLWRCQGAGGKTAQSEQVAKSGFCFSNEKEKW